MLLFVDESGSDGGASPYAVLAGVAMLEKSLWPLIREIHDSASAFLGCRCSKCRMNPKQEHS